MPDLHSTSSNETDQNWLISSYATLSILACTVVVIVALLQITSLAECALLLVAGIALSCGALFTIVTMQRLANRE